MSVSNVTNWEPHKLKLECRCYQVSCDEKNVLEKLNLNAIRGAYTSLLPSDSLFPGSYTDPHQSFLLFD